MVNLYKKFEDSINNLKDNNLATIDKVAIAVSGGADSVALAMLFCQYAQANNIKLVALTVNHHLRKESGDEVEYVSALMKKFLIEHYVLDWNFEEKPQTAIEEKAREARYGLLIDWCKQNGYNQLVTAHHQRDQAETFLMRLQRGSGVDGLAAMGKVFVRDDVSIIRPLLDFDPKDLQKYLRAQNVSWVEDSSNQCDDFLRVRVRKILPLLDRNLNLSVARIANTTLAMASVRDYFEQEVVSYLHKNTKNWSNLAFSFAPKDFNNLHIELKTRILAKIIRLVGKGFYAPTYVELIALITAMQADNFRGRTLGGCEIKKFQQKFWVIKESCKVKQISKKDWQDYVEKNKEYKNIDLPYKLKINLVDLDTF